MKGNSPNQQRSRSTRLGLGHALVGLLSRGISGTIRLVLTTTSWVHGDQKANAAAIPRRRGTQAHPVWSWQFQQMWASQ